MDQKSLSNKVFGTLGASVLTMTIQLVVLLFVLREFSITDNGIISLFILNVMIIMQVSSFIGGSALVFMTSRTDLRSLLYPSYIWTFLASGLTFCVLYFTGQLEENGLWLVLIAGIFQGLLTVNQQLLLGMNNIRWYNASQLIMHSVNLGLLYVLVFHHSDKHYTDFMYSYLFAAALTWVITSFFVIFPRIDWSANYDKTVLKKLLRFGFVIQTGSLAQAFNNRAAFYILNASFFFGKELVGMLSAGLKIIEKMMVVSRSFSSVQYAEISNLRDHEKAVDVTKSFMKITFWITLLGGLIAILIPEDIYLLVISDKFAGVKEIIIYLIPAIILLAVSNILSHYFSGLGKYYINTVGAVLGLLITVSAGVLLIPEYGILGAVITMNASYFVLTTYQFYEFYRRTSFTIMDWIPTRSDFQRLRKGRLV